MPAHTVISMCTFQMWVVQPLVEALFLAVQEFNFLVYSEPGSIYCSFLVLWFLSVNLDADVIRF
jgi:hypothetical protein